MSVHLQREMEKLQELVLRLCGTVEDQVSRALRAFEQQDEQGARQVIAADEDVDQAEVRLEEEALKMLALYQPVAIDLRRIVAFIKINSDLERIADYAVNVAKRQLELGGRASYPAEFQFADMVTAVNRQLRRSVAALVQLDSDMAWDVILQDEPIDKLNRDMARRAEARLRSEPDLAPTMLQIYSVSRSLERIGDHAVNIAEDVLYLITGQIVRHTHKAWRKAQRAALAAGTDPIPPPTS
ncbi:MAG: phosphate signaling complex protein PhoU [Candidatus Marinimicrobia bacterium]|nr:phosphate signaling complex protein PhoU [Candidatus Neomarinimicrobiota bacterium]